MTLFENVTATHVVCLALFMIIVFFGVFVILKPKSKPPQPPTLVERYTPPTRFQVYNYLPFHSVKIEVVPSEFAASKTMKSSTLVKEIKPKSKANVKAGDVIKYFKPGNVLRFYVFSPEQPEPVHYTDYVIDTRNTERIKALHIGMITTRFLGSTDTFRMTVPAANAGEGQPWLKIHNLTNIPLHLNGHIEIKPHDVFRYQGYLNMGVPLGTWLRDDEKLYPTFQYLQPHSDLYYGVVSDLQQPLLGPWQLEFSDECQYGDTLWPLEDGIY